VQAQEDEGPLLTVLIMQIKTGRVPEFLALQKEHAAARKAEGRTGRGVYQVVRGAVGTFQVINFAENFAEFDADPNPPMDAGAWATWVARVTDVIQTSQLVTLRMHPDLAISASGRRPAENVDVALPYGRPGPE
jgi:hypothetical protein